MATKKNLRLSNGVDTCFIMSKLSLETLKACGEAELKILLFVAQEGNADPSKLSAKLDIDQNTVDCAIKNLTEMAVIFSGEEKIKKPSKKASSNYDNEDLADAIDNDDGFKQVTNFTCDILEKQLNRNDLNTLFSLYDYYGMSAEMICGVVEYCASTGKHSMSYVFNTALEIRDDGIASYEELEAYIKAKRTANSKATRFRKLCGIGNRELTSKERSYTDRWFGEMKLSFDLVKKAYELTIDRIGELKLPYMSKIIEQWYAKGVRTVEDAEKADAKHKEEKAVENSDYDIEKYFAAAAKKGFIKQDGQQ